MGFIYPLFFHGNFEVMHRIKINVTFDPRTIDGYPGTQIARRALFRYRISHAGSSFSSENPVAHRLLCCSGSNLGV